MDVLQNKPQAQQTQPIVVNHRHDDPNIMFERFKKRGPREFLGQEDPIAADDWLTNTERIFDVFTCTNRVRVNPTASLFYDLADSWWQTVRAPYQTMSEAIVWTTFKVQFTDKYIPAHIKRQKREEFQQL